MAVVYVTSTATITSDADVEATIGSSGSVSVVGAVIVDALSMLNSADARSPGGAGSIGIAVSLLESRAEVGGGTKAQVDGDILDAGQLVVKANGTNTAFAETKTVSLAQAPGGLRLRRSWVQRMSRQVSVAARR